MNAVAAMASGLYAALRLARGRADGALLVPGDRVSAVRSFWAMFFCVPSVVCRLLISWAVSGIPSNPGHLAARELIIFVLNWLVFVEVTYWLSPVLARAERWGRFITLWNWCNVVEGLLVVIGAIPALFGVPPIVDQACELIMIGWALWLEWYAIRLGLGIGGLPAAWMVVLDQAIGITLASLAIMLGS
jgi:hypothetical protein